MFEKTVHTVSKCLHMDGVFMKFRIFIWVICVFAAAFVLFGVENHILQQGIAEKTIRLHVLAASDSEEDQKHKLVVRDAVLAKVDELTAGCADVDSAKQIIQSNLAQIRLAAQTVSQEKIEVSFGDKGFDTRVYDHFTLPAGTYSSLTVRIGAAEGRNWWCVVFPSLCKAATTDAFEQCAEVGGLDDRERALITGGEETYKLRFKTLQWLKKLFFS
ncbi:MAG: stage II sporulation protein R [Ruminococcaceae bacterium]|nr:stage II sporulation protein R [Oscillospiraceae bacterium]